MTPGRYKMGAPQRLASELRIGDRVDLYNDEFADGEETDDHPEFEFEFLAVEDHQGGVGPNAPASTFRTAFRAASRPITGSVATAR